MNDLIERIDERFLAKLQKEMLACPRCDTYERKPGESETDHEARASEKHDYLIYPHRALPEYGDLLLLGPCEDHMLMQVAAGMVSDGFELHLKWLGHG